MPTTTNTIERTILNHLVDSLLEQGCTLSLSNGEEWVVKKSADKAAIMAGVMTTDEDYLRVYKGGERLGTVSLVYGNDGTDVISDYSVSLESLLKPTNDFAAALDAGELTLVAYQGAKNDSQQRTIHADVKSEGSTYNVRLFDQHGLELPMFVYEARYDGVTMQHDTAISKAFAVRDFINSLCPTARSAMYDAQR